MTILNWQSNDPLSTFDTDNKKFVNGVATDVRVETGYANLKMPKDSDFEFFKVLGKSLQQRFKVLSPTEALRIKLNADVDSLAATTNLYGVNVWKVVTDRYLNPGNRLALYLSQVGAFHTPTAKLQLLQSLAESEVDDCVTIISTFLGSTVKNLIVDKTKTPAEILNNYGKSRFGQVEEPNFQTTFNASREVNRVVDRNVYSRSYNGTEANPVNDFITSAFCRRFVNPNGQPNRSWVKAGLRNPSVEEIARLGLGDFYPHLNLSQIPNNYPTSKSEAVKIRDTLYAVRRISVMDLSIAKSFGTGETLKAVFDQGPPYVKLSIATTLYPWVHDSSNPLGSDRSTKDLRFRWSRVPGQPTTYVLGHKLTQTLFLMDYMNKSQTLNKHVVGYLAWIKSKCELAMSLQRTSSALAKLPMINTVSPKALSVARNLYKPIAQNLYKPFIKPSINFLQTSQSGASQDTKVAQQQIVADSPAEIAAIDGGKVFREQQRQKQLEEEKRAEEKRKRNLYIYVGSGVIACSAIAGLIYVKSKREN